MYLRADPVSEEAKPGAAPPDDVLGALEKIQEPRSWERLPVIYQTARRAYLFGMDGLQKQDPFTDHVRTHRAMASSNALDAAYRRIARHYREAYHPHGQRMLEFEDIPYEQLLGKEWDAFYPQEITRLTEQDAAITIAILSIEVYADEEPADAAGEFLLSLLDFRYGPRWRHDANSHQTADEGHMSKREIE